MRFFIMTTVALLLSSAQLAYSASPTNPSKLDCSHYQECGVSTPCKDSKLECIQTGQCSKAICISSKDACKAVCGDAECLTQETYPLGISCLKSK